jgi:hypothetical protein
MTRDGILPVNLQAVTGLLICCISGQLVTLLKREKEREKKESNIKKEKRKKKREISISILLMIGCQHNTNWINPE